ncbi:MAG: DUF5103 domain-containing protein [Candidatus Azobacteroides sp.]|nr:DUF5103 domain-containing protein [Candidatus Azobacteroides sp.]
MKYFLLLTVSLFFGINISAQKTFRTDIFSANINTLQLIVNENRLLPPVINLRSGDYIEISFDELSANQTRYTYSVIHCNADWTKSSLTPVEYMTGFQDQLINDYASSYNTTVDYTHYKLYFPNDDTNFLVSGNYVVLVSEEGHEDRPVLSACFSVVEQQVKTQMSVSANTEIDFNNSHQQLSVTVTYSPNAFTAMPDFKIYALQNNRRDNMVLLSAPSGMQPGKLTFEHNRNLIFEAGNEYRRFESVSTQSNGMNVQQIRYYSPLYHITLYPDEIRSRKSYLYDEDQNGRFFIRSSNASNYDIESDYTFVHFSIPCEHPFSEDIYILSEVYNNILDERSKISYNDDTKSYEKAAFLKQGLYNYLYVSKNNNKIITELIEGNYFQTENEYMILVYYRPPGGRYDKLIGMQNMKFVL